MLRILIFSTCIIASLFSFSQEKAATDSTELTTVADTATVDNVDTIRFSRTEYLWGAYLGYIWGVSPGPASLEPLESVQIGFQYKSLFLEYGVHSYQGSYTYLLIFPNEFGINHLSGEITAGVRLFNRRYMEAYLAAGFGQGDMIWERLSNFENLFRDKFSTIKGEFRVELTPIKFARLTGVIGYRRISGLDLPALTSEDFSGLYLGVGLKGGFFKMKKL